MKSALTHLFQKGQNAQEEMEAFNYLASITDRQRGTDEDIKARMGKARPAFLQLKNI